MSHPLDGCWAKIARADAHFQELESQVTSTPDQAQSIRFAQQFDPDTSTIQVTLEGVQELPVEWSLIAADALQNLRAALNYLAWELARWNLAQGGQTRDPVEDTQFPINTKPPTRENPTAFSDRFLTDLDPSHVARIKELQPNAGPFLSQFSEAMLAKLPVEILTMQHPLAKLANLTNEDKHKVLLRSAISSAVTQVGSYEGIDCLIEDANVFVQVELKNGAKWAEFKVSPTGPEPKVKMHDQLGPSTIRFGSRGCPIGDLPEIRDATASIIAEFVAVF